MGERVADTIEIKWGTSKGRDTYGYTTCNVYNGRDKRRGSCNGGGYDLQGTAFGEYLEKDWTDRLNALALANLDKLPQYEGGVNLNVNKTDKAFYGMTTIFKGGKFHHVNLDGACGFNCMVRIAEAMGLRVRKVHSSSKLDIFDIIDTQGE